jgi:hypothetical protein
MNNLWKTPRPYFALQNSLRNAKEFLRNLDNLGRCPQKRSSSHVLNRRLVVPKGQCAHFEEKTILLLRQGMNLDSSAFQHVA